MTRRVQEHRRGKVGPVYTYVVHQAESKRRTGRTGFHSLWHALSERHMQQKTTKTAGGPPWDMECLTEPARTSGAGGASAYTLGPVFYCSATLHTLFITYSDAFSAHLPCWTQSLTQQFLAHDGHVTNAWQRDASRPLSPRTSSQTYEGKSKRTARITTNRLQAPLRTGTMSDLLITIFSIM